ncbi:hypothetical protein [Orenia marismortui]|uniref:Uncharacterized protein n=1 Tax=Orenia marismortui TaxID=46469 RepID=A0A4R8GVV6_9FIRM|nr:hypothetical protein [Orenia marismortui]TDX49161.1 hypothetical protein C7959_12055 [Orenia marismortui]
MKKLKFIFLTILIISLIVYFNVNKIDKQNNDTLSSFEKSRFFSNFKKRDEIDFSDINYLSAETTKDEKLEEAFAKVYNLKKGRDEIRYYYNRIDLNGDDKQEFFVLLVGRVVCGSGGCSALLFEDNNDEYNLISRFSLVNNPIIISKDKTNGWNDIIIPVAGGGIKNFFAQMKFNGKKYPLNPSIEPAIKVGAKIKGTAIVADDLLKSKGIKF